MFTSLMFEVKYDKKGNYNNTTVKCGNEDCDTVINLGYLPFLEPGNIEKDRIITCPKCKAKTMLSGNAKAYKIDTIKSVSNITKYGTTPYRADCPYCSFTTKVYLRKLFYNDRKTDYAETCQHCNRSFKIVNSPKVVTV